MNILEVHMRVLVSGGAGYIGSHTVLELLESNHEVLITDNFYNSSPEVLKRLNKLSGQDIPFIEADMTHMNEVLNIFETQGKFDAVIHFAAYKAVGESCSKPIEYYKNNLMSTLNLLDAMRQYDCFKFVYSSSATVYGDPEVLPVSEDYGTHEATNPYGETKVMCERIMSDVALSDDRFSFTALRYANPLGAHHSGLIGEDPNGIPNNLVPYVAKVAVGKLEKINVFGNDYNTPDGTGVRDYIHVVDLAKGHVAALKELESRQGFDAINLGTGNGFSVLEIIKTYSEICGKELKYEIVGRRPGDIAENYLNPSKAFEKLGWKAEYDLKRMLEDSWRWQSNNPDGYNSK